jgi:hypothetical protein
LEQGTDFVGAAVAYCLIMALGWETAGFVFPLVFGGKRPFAGLISA